MARYVLKRITNLSQTMKLQIILRPLKRGDVRRRNMHVLIAINSSIAPCLWVYTLTRILEINVSFIIKTLDSIILPETTSIHMPIPKLLETVQCKF